jgi:hypothetical protein
VPLLRFSTFAFVCAAVVLLLPGCRTDPAPAPPALALKVGTVRAALSSAPSPCPAVGACTLYPDADTTVYAGAAKDYGKSHEMCVGIGGANGAARALLHFNLGLLPAHFFATSASLTISGRRGIAASLSLYRLTGGSWGEGDGVGLADGHVSGGCTGCTSTGACGWAGTGSVNNAAFGVTSNIGSPSATVAFALPGTVTFNGLAADVRAQASGSNPGWTIISSNEAASGSIVFWSTDTATGDANKPGLAVSYGRGPGASGCAVNSDCFFSNGATGFCAGGVCCSGICADEGNQCTNEACDSNGTCTHPLRGGACDDGNACTSGETCQGGSCTGGTPMTCPAADQCHTQASCSGGACPANPAKPNGTSCNDGNSCTTGETCQGGACTGGTGIVCPAADQCHNQASCTGGVCPVNPGKPDGTPCSDGNTCTTGETCQSGSCTGGSGVVCPIADQCHIQASCSGGVCPLNAAKPNGTPCNDGNLCTNGESCQAGTCTNGTPVQCTALDQCHTAGACNSSTGACSNPTKANGTPCDDGVFCTTPDACTGGVCGGPARQCNDGIACTIDGCSNAQAHCTADPAPCGCTKDADCENGNACDGIGTCDMAILTCKPGTPVDCTAQSDQCNVGTCNPSNGACSAVAKPSGTTCDDGNECTQTDACQSGKCLGSNPVVCTILDQCHGLGTCNTGTGVCSNPALANGTTCNDGNACTSSDACSGGSCRGGPAVDCTDTNACTADACNTATGCVHPAGNGGTACGNPASCGGGKESLATACSGSSTVCPAAVVHDCAPYACGATSCLKACAKDADCAQGNYCAAGGKCTAKGGPGATCSTGVQCLSSFCADGVCCNDDCVGQCEACNLPNKAGTCSPVAGKPVAPRPSCVGNGTGCDGTCNGVQTNACAVPGQSTQCRAPSCDAVAAVATLGESCDGSGACPEKRTQDCKPGICGVTQCTGCSTNATCPPGDFCRGGVCKPLAVIGTKCSIDAECTSGHCVDGVCCDHDCTGQCEACNQTDHVGTCTPIPAGQGPAEGRAGCAGDPTKCGGICDGTTTRSCSYPGPGRLCRGAKCENGIATLVAFCDGSGSCPAESQQTCPQGYVCDNGRCGGGPSECISEDDCNNNQFCSGGICRQKSGPGAPCNASVECGSDVCVDGVCCTKACLGQCEACNIRGSEGTCIPVAGAPPGSRQACASDGTICGGVCDGVVGDRCTYKGAATSCRPGACANGLADLPAFCQGNGSCAPRQQQSCDPFACDTARVACAGNCKTNANCAANQFCAAGVCVARQAVGATCGAPEHCASNHCVDGLCCDQACDGQCEACDQVDHLGTCITISGAPRDGRPGCVGFGECGGFCDGARGAGCVLPGRDVICGEGFCSGGAAATEPKCNGAATCVVPPVRSCDPFQCDEQGASCSTACERDTDCSPGLVCDARGGCVQPSSDGGVGPDRDASVGGGGGVDGGTGVGGSDGGRGGATGGSGGASSGGKLANTGGSAGNTELDGGMTTHSDAGPHQNSKDEGSCACGVPGSRGRGASGTSVFGVLMLLAARRRRERANAARENRYFEISPPA